MASKPADALDSWEDLDNQLGEIGKGRVSVGKEKLYEIDTDRASLADGPRGACDGSNTAGNEFTGQERPCVYSSQLGDIDDQILETLAHHRFRIKLLRLEQEIAKFVQSSLRSLEFGDLQELDGLPPFFRVLTKKVGLLYKLNVEHRDGLYYLEKTGETRIPQKSLADISNESVAVETDNTTQQVTKKQVLLKKSLSASNSSSDISGLEASEDQPSTIESTAAHSGRPHLTSAKSVEKRLQDYEKARSRIFQFEEKQKDEKTENDGESRDQSAKVQNASPETKARMNSPPKPPQGRKQRKQVAIFRNREEERLDPDFQRNFGRGQSIRNYAQISSTSPPLPPYPPHQFQYQMPTYDSEFPALGGPPGQAHMGPYPRTGNYGAFHGQGQNQQQKYSPSQAYPNSNPYVDRVQSWQNATPLYPPPNHQTGAHGRVGGIQNQPRAPVNMNMYGGACQTETSGSQQHAQWVGATPLPYTPGPYSQNSVFSSGYYAAHPKQNNGSS